MESKLLTIISKNGTGILKGNFSAIFSNYIFSEGTKIMVLFSKDEIALGSHLLLIERINKKKNAIFCVILHNDGDGTIYEPLDGFKDPVNIILFPFTHWDTLDTIGEFIAEFPTIDNLSSI